MKRIATLSMTAAAAALAASSAFAESPQAATGTSTEVASDAPKAYDTNSPRLTNGKAEMDPTVIEFSTDTMLALEAASGEMLKTNEGTQIGLIEDVTYNAQGNPEIIVDVLDDAAIAAETLVVTVQPGNIALADNKLFLDTTYDELLLKVAADGNRGSNDRVDVTLF